MNPQEISQQLYLCEFELHVQQAEIHIKFPCTFFLTWSLDRLGQSNRSSISTASNQVELNGSTIPFRTTLRLEAEMLFDCKLNTFRQKISTITVFLNSLSRMNDEPKLAGLFRADLAACFNSCLYSQQQQYQLERCPDKSSAIMFAIQAKKVRELDFTKDNLSLQKQCFPLSGSYNEKSSSSASTTKVENRKQERLQRKEFELEKERRDYEPLDRSLKSPNGKTISEFSSPSQGYISSAEVHGEVRQVKNQYLQATETETYIGLLKNEIETLREKLRIEEGRTASALRGVASSNIGLREVSNRHQEMELQQVRGQLASASEQLVLLTKFNAKLTDELRWRGTEWQRNSNDRTSLQILEEKLNSTIGILTANQQELLQERQRNVEILQRMDQMQFDQRDKERSNQQLRSELNFMKASKQEFEEQLHSYQERQQLFKINFEEIEQRTNNLIRQLREREEHSDNLVLRLEEVAEELVQTSTKLRFVESQLAEREQTIKCISQDLGDVQEENRSLQLEVQHVAKQNLELQTSMGEHHFRHEEDKRRLRRQLSEAQKLVDENKQAFFDAMKEQKLLATQLLRLQEKYADLEALTIQITQEKQQLQGTVDQMKLSVEKSNSDKFKTSILSNTDIAKKLDAANQQIISLKNQIKAKDIAIRELQSCVTSFVEEGRKNSVDYAKSEYCSESVESLILNDEQPHINIVPPEEHSIEILLEKLRAKNMGLQEELFQQSSRHHQLQMRHEELIEEHQRLAKELENKQSKLSSVISLVESLKLDLNERNRQIELQCTVEARLSAEVGRLQNALNGEGSPHHLRRLYEGQLFELRGIISELERKIVLLRESEDLNMNEVKMLREQCEQYKSLYEQTNRKALEFKEQMSIMRAESRYHSPRESRHDHQLQAILREYTGILRGYYENSMQDKRELQQRVLELVTRNREVSEHFRNRLAGKEEIDQKLSELFKELQRFKAQLLSKSPSLENKRQVLASTKPFQLKIEEVRTQFYQLTNRPGEVDVVAKQTPATSKPATITNQQLKIVASKGVQQRIRSISK